MPRAKGGTALVAWQGTLGYLCLFPDISSHSNQLLIPFGSQCIVEASNTEIFVAIYLSLGRNDRIKFVATIRQVRSPFPLLQFPPSSNFPTCNHPQWSVMESTDCPPPVCPSHHVLTENGQQCRQRPHSTSTCCSRSLWGWRLASQWSASLQ